MSKKFKSQASSARAASTAFGGLSLGFGSQPSAFQTKASPLSYVTEIPDLSGISDPSIVVAFKNLNKKDSVTKGKALEDLRDAISSNPESGPEAAVLEAWINIYPRTSIDSARRVRQLAHSFQGSLTASSGKRIAPHLPKVIGAWLTGTFDADRSVSRAAQEAFERAFPSEEKRKSVWKLYQASLLEYVEDAILRHTPRTLSDERSTSPDDAEAKYVRVVSSALLALDQLLLIDSKPNALGSNEIFQTIIKSKTTWEFASHNDSSVRRAVYKLIMDAINAEVQLDWKLLSSCFLAKSLHISQMSSSMQFINVLVAITEAHPLVWTSDYASKTPVSRRLCQYIKQGSQRGPEEWWSHLRLLIKAIPTEAWKDAPDLDEEVVASARASQILNALHEGVTTGDEPRQNTAAAWSTYSDILFWMLVTLPGDEAQNQLVQSFLYPIIERHLLASPELSQWIVPASVGLALCASSIVKLESICPASRPAAFYLRNVGNLIETMKMSQPESSKTFKASQDDLIQKARRFLDLQSTVEKNAALRAAGKEQPISALSATFVQSNIDLISQGIKLLRDRNGKPYGAAGVIYIILDKMPEMILQISTSSKPDLLSELLNDEALKLLHSPSAELLISILLKCRTVPHFEKSFDIILKQFLQDEPLRRSHAYRTFLRGITVEDLLHHPDLEQKVLQDIQSALGGDDSCWPAIYEILTNQNLKQHHKPLDSASGQAIQGRVLQHMLSGLMVDETSGNALKGFDFVLKWDSSLFAPHIDLASLLTRLLLISDSANEEKAGTAARLASSVKMLFAQQGDSGTGASAIEIVDRQLDGEGEALSILSLVDIAGEALQGTALDPGSGVASALFPTSAHWQKALTPFTQLQPSPSISLITPLRGCAFLVDRYRRRSSGGLVRDSEGYSVALRLVIFVTRLLEKVSREELTNEQLETLYLYYPQALQLANDKLSIESANALWIDSTEEVFQEMTHVVAKGQKFLQSWLVHEMSNGADDRPTFASCWLSQMEEISGNSAQAYNLARTFTTIMTELIDLRGAAQYMPAFDSSLRAVRSSPDIMKSAAVLDICRETLAGNPLGKRLCNEFVADATEIGFDESGDATHRLVLLNLLIKGEDDLVGNVPSQRLIFLAKHLLSIPSFNDAPAGLQSELMSTLTSILPPLSELYGDFWLQTVTLVTDYLSSVDDAFQIVPLYSALRLLACLDSLVKRESNEDLEEELLKAKPSLETSLLEILTHFDEIPLGVNQPLEITTALLARQVRNLQFDNPDELTDLYPLLSSEDRAVQGAAYGILDRSLPSIQEQLSIEVAISKTVPHLPEELLSLLLDTPSMDMLNNNEYSNNSVWLNIRQYLLSWKVVFDHFSTASYVVREAYVLDIKNYGNLEYLLSFTCDILRIASGKPIDVSRYDILTFALDEETSSEKESQWLTTHLYYLSLLYLPSLTKAWWIDQKNRIKTPLESWSQKHISPLIISATLTTVSEWLTTQDPSEERALALKINSRASEVIASISIDPESPQISLCITLPPNYPFAPALVTSRARVAVSEQKWQSWLRTIQGIIMFSNGSVVDGLLAFRRNVQGALKGQSECAICYSVIGSDMKTPDKKCATCKNTFHSACLFRWFKSSNSSSCPLCRNAFHYA